MVALKNAQPRSETVQSISAVQLCKCYAANDIWASVLPQQPLSPPSSSPDVPPQIQQLLGEFTEVFNEPSSLPQHMKFDHAISILPGATPVNCRPYRYNPQQKDKIEKQVNAMLRAGTILPSMSPYASPVLLVKKKDGSWRFCVDYRRLNELTVKNKFSMPVIEELLDELAGQSSSPNWT